MRTRTCYCLRALPRLLPLEPFEHAFTHFILEVAPWRIHPTPAACRPPLAADRRSIWLPLDEVKGAALPSPVKKLLLSL